MSRIIWFALGAAAGVAYATQAIHVAHLDLPPGAPPAPRPPKPVSEAEHGDLRTRIAGLIEAQAERLSAIIRGQGASLADKVRPEVNLPPIPRLPKLYASPEAASSFATADAPGLEATRF